ncbi:MAG TPA: class F sortase [Acidimicrobiia bacterium]|nr:class F sortase [Acidimicrobiia bacterium]
MQFAMRLALGLAILGVLLGVVATAGLLSRPGDEGEPDAVEESLRLRPSTTTTVPEFETTMPIETPRWSANDVSLLGEAPITEGPYPQRLVIGALEIDAPIGAYGVAANGQMDVPDNVTEVGWYEFGPSPGEAGSAVLAAHVDLAGPGRGLFYDLDELEVGDDVVVGFDDGESRAFRVVASRTYLKSELPLDAIFSRDGDPVLTLVTCGGGFSSSTGRYDSNVVVYAIPVDEVSAEDFS